MRTQHLRTLAALGVAATLLSACKEEKRVAQYTVPKETRVAAPPAGAPAMTPNAELVKQTAGFAAPVWIVPTGWRAMPESPMRKGGWKTGPDAAPAEISVTAFPGDVGGFQANVARWCGQIGLPAPATAEELAKLTAPATVSGIHSTRVALTNDGKSLTAVLVKHDEATWFFKIVGGETAVTAATGEFDAFVGSVKFPAAK